MHAQQNETPGRVDQRPGFSRESNADTSGAIEDPQQVIPWWEEWGTADNEWGELDRSERYRKK